MTRRQFYREFKKIGLHFGLGDKTIRGRMEGKEVCPVTGVHLRKTGKHLEINHVTFAGTELGLSPRDTWLIARAADGGRSHAQIRKALLSRIR